MYPIQNYSPAVQTVKASTTPAGVSETELEQTVGIALLADYNQQLADIAQTMQENLSAKRTAQEEITEIQLINTRDSVEIAGTSYVEINGDEYNAIKSAYPTLGIKEENGKYYVSKSGLESVISAKQQELAGLNTTSEMISLQIQSIVDQRKQAITMLSNLLASRNDTLMTIVNNLK